MSHHFHASEIGAKTCTSMVEGSNNEVKPLINYFHLRPFEPSDLALAEQQYQCNSLPEPLFWKKGTRDMAVKYVAPAISVL